MARQSRAQDVARPRFRESGSSKAVTSTQEPNKTVHQSFLFAFLSAFRSFAV